MTESEFKERITELRANRDEHGEYWLQVTYAYANRPEGIDYGDTLTDRWGREFVVDTISASGYVWERLPHMVYKGKTKEGKVTIANQYEINTEENK